MNRIKNVLFLGAPALLAAMVLCQFADAETLVSTIDGFYGGTYYDTPWLTISNSTGYSFTDVVLTATGYDGLNNGASQSVNLGTISANSTDTVVWGVQGAGPVVNPTTAYTNFFADDYDDEYGGTAYAGSTTDPSGGICTINDTQYGVSEYYFCADTGNFYVTLTATWNNPAYGLGGTEIYSQFSPGEDPYGIGNACGNTSSCYIGWEGLDPNGWSETANDDHSSGGPNGVLADIYVGSPPPVGTTPEPGTLLLFGSGLAMIGLLRRRWA
jgi:hypothetical protein